MNVGKGSRQNRSVTLGKGLALRVGRVGPQRLKFNAESYFGNTLCETSYKTVPLVIINQLRTGADKGNLTV